MNPGPIDDAGKVATSAIDALKSQPLVLYLMIFNVLFIVGTVYVGLQRIEQMNNLINRCFEIQDAGTLPTPRPRP